MRVTQPDASCTGLEGAGSVGLVCQWASLVVTLVLSSVLMHPAGSHVLAAGLVASRFGLWAFDLAVSQMLQERVPLEQLGAPKFLQPADSAVCPCNQ